MRALVVGGTGFLGGAIVDACLQSGYDVTVLSRGIKGAAKNPDVRYIVDDRYGTLDTIDRCQFDFVFDTCAFEPRAVQNLLHNLNCDLRRYVFVSSCSVYGERAFSGINEDAEVATATNVDFSVVEGVPMDKRANAAAYGASYGPLKRACEIVAERMLGDRAISLRAGLLVGAGDYTDRLTWWVRRIDEGGLLPVPLPENRPIQLIDVRDAATFAVRVAASGQSGIFNLTGHGTEMADLIEIIRGVTASEVEFRWLDESKFLEQGLHPWTDLPLIVPPAEGFRHFLELSVDKALAAGLRCRPTSETINSILGWDRGRRDQSLVCGLTPEQESSVLSV